jgi:hypothetical protein
MRWTKGDRGHVLKSSDAKPASSPECLGGVGFRCRYIQDSSCFTRDAPDNRERSESARQRGPTGPMALILHRFSWIFSHFLLRTAMREPMRRYKPLA